MQVISYGRRILRHHKRSGKAKPPVDSTNLAPLGAPVVGRQKHTRSHRTRGSWLTRFVANRARSSGGQARKPRAWASRDATSDTDVDIVLPPLPIRYAAHRNTPGRRPRSKRGRERVRPSTGTGTRDRPVERGGTLRRERPRIL